MIGRGKYDQLCTEAREKAKADGAILIILDDARGFGFSVQLPLEEMARVPAILRNVAATIERDMEAELHEIAKEITLSVGCPWTDPRTGETHDPPGNLDTKNP